MVFGTRVCHSARNVAISRFVASIGDFQRFVGAISTPVNPAARRAFATASSSAGSQAMFEAAKGKMWVMKGRSPSLCSGRRRTALSLARGLLVIDEAANALELRHFILDIVPQAAEQLCVASPNIVASRPFDDVVGEIATEGSQCDVRDRHWRRRQVNDLQTIRQRNL